MRLKLNITDCEDFYVNEISVQPFQQFKLQNYIFLLNIQIFFIDQYHNQRNFFFFTINMNPKTFLITTQQGSVKLRISILHYYACLFLKLNIFFHKEKKNVWNNLAVDTKNITSQRDFRTFPWKQEKTSIYLLLQTGRKMFSYENFLC